MGCHALVGHANSPDCHVLIGHAVSPSCQRSIEQSHGKGGNWWSERDKTDEASAMSATVAIASTRPPRPLVPRVGAASVHDDNASSQLIQTGQRTRPSEH